MRRRTAVSAVLLFFALAPAVLLFYVLFATGNFSEGQAGMVLALCALVLLIFGLLTPIAAGMLCRRFSCASQTASPSLDNLTGLLCRTAAEEEARGVLAAPPEGACALILADIQRLGAVNERLGYEGGDRLLRALADALRPLFAARCVSGRIAHDTFLICVSLPPAQTEKSLSAELQALQEQWPRLLADLDDSLCGTVKLALGAAWSTRGATFEALYSGADRALLQARRDGMPYRIQKQT